MHANHDTYLCISVFVLVCMYVCNICAFVFYAYRYLHACMSILFIYMFKRMRLSIYVFFAYCSDCLSGKGVLFSKAIKKIAHNLFLWASVTIFSSTL